jgi:hypothetical protein
MQVLQIIGALMILVPFAAAQFGWLLTTSISYLTLNLAGSVLLAWLALEERQWGFLLLEAVWAAVSLWGLVAALRGKPLAAGAH